MPQPTAESWTTRKLLAWMSGAFEQKGLDSAKLQAEMMLAHVLNCRRLDLYMDADRPASPIERQTLRDLVQRALAHEPIDYLVGEAPFYGLEFTVDNRVLVPRPSTNTVVDAVLRHARDNPGFGGVRESDAGSGMLIADVCTGSGCIAVTLAKHLPGARVVATDISQDALDVAAVNAARHAVDDRVEFAQGDLLAPLEAHVATRGAGSLHYLCSNPPYIPDNEWADVEPNVKDHEPTIALRGGADGLDFVRPLIELGPRFIAPGGLLVIETASATSERTKSLMESQGDLDNIRVIKDHEGLPRTVVGSRIG